MGRYVLVDTGTNTVTDSLMWDGVTEWTPPSGFTVIQSDEATDGWSYVKGEFIAPEPVPQEPPSPEAILAGNTAYKASLLSSAALAIAPLQDAVDLGEETTEEVALLKAWKQYRVALNRVDLSTQVVAWPVLPV